MTGWTRWLVGFAALWMIAPASALADEAAATDAALAADDVNQEHCANLYSTKVDTAASSTVVVAEVWQQVSEVYEETKAPYLLFWRGALAQCLGREESASADFEAFIASQEGSMAFANLVDRAKRRLARLGGKAAVGQGLSAAWLRRGPRLEVFGRYGLGGGLSILSCTDEGRFGVDGARPENSGCVGGTSARSAVGASIAPVGLDVGFDGFFSRSFGLGVRALFDLSDSMLGPGAIGFAVRPPTPTLEFQFGPQLRVLNSVASGARAGWLRATLRLAVAAGPLAAWAGQTKYVDEMEAFHDVGTWALVQLGPALTVAGAVEVGKGAVLEMEGRFSIYAPMGPAATRKTREGQSVTVVIDEAGTTRDEEFAAEYQPDVVRSSRLHAGFRLSQWKPLESGNGALGPFFDVGLIQTGLKFPNSNDDVWCATGGDFDGCADPDLRKVYSTLRSELILRAGIQVRFGAGE